MKLAIDLVIVVIGVGGVIVAMLKILPLTP